MTPVVGENVRIIVSICFPVTILSCVNSTSPDTIDLLMDTSAHSEAQHRLHLGDIYSLQIPQVYLLRAADSFFKKKKEKERGKKNSGMSTGNDYLLHTCLWLLLFI
jgi:hypothetical protein